MGATMTAEGARPRGEEHAALLANFILYKFGLGDKRETICNLYDRKSQVTQHNAALVKTDLVRTNCSIRGLQLGFVHV